MSYNVRTVKIENDTTALTSFYSINELFFLLCSSVASPKFKALQIDEVIQFPKDRISQVYEQFVVNLQTETPKYHSVEGIGDYVKYCMVSLEYLIVSFPINCVAFEICRRIQDW